MSHTHESSAVFIRYPHSNCTFDVRTTIAFRTSDHRCIYSSVGDLVLTRLSISTCIRSIRNAVVQSMLLFNRCSRGSCLVMCMDGRTASAGSHKGVIRIIHEHVKHVFWEAMCLETVLFVVHLVSLSVLIKLVT